MAAGVVSTRRKAILITPGSGSTFTIDCDPNEKVIGGGHWRAGDCPNCAEASRYAVSLIDGWPG
jgi:hypothetical protein